MEPHLLKKYIENKISSYFDGSTQKNKQSQDIASTLKPMNTVGKKHHERAKSAYQQQRVARKPQSICEGMKLRKKPKDGVLDLPDPKLKQLENFRKAQLRHNQIAQKKFSQEMTDIMEIIDYKKKPIPLEKIGQDKKSIKHRRNRTDFQNYTEPQVDVALDSQSQNNYPSDHKNLSQFARIQKRNPKYNLKVDISQRRQSYGAQNLEESIGSLQNSKREAKKMKSQLSRSHLEDNNNIEALSPALENIKQKNKKFAMAASTLLLTPSLLPKEEERLNESPSPIIMQKKKNVMKELNDFVDLFKFEDDSKILDIIGREILFNKEKAMISKYLINQKDVNKTDVNIRKRIIDKQLCDKGKRERLLEQSVFRDFHYEDQLQQKKRLIKYSLDSHQLSKINPYLKDSESKQILDSLNSLPEVIKPSHIRVNIGNNNKKFPSIREKENMVHRNIVKKTIAANLDAIKIEHDREKNIGVINYLLEYKNDESASHNSSALLKKAYIDILNLRKLYAFILSYDDSHKTMITWSKFKRFTKELAFYGRKGYFTVDFEKTFYESISDRKTNKMRFDEFVESLESIAHACYLNEAPLNPQDSMLKFLKFTVLPFYNKNCMDAIMTMKDMKEIKDFFIKHKKFLVSLYSLIKTIYIPEEAAVGIDGITFKQMIEMAKILFLYPAVLSNNEILTIFLNSLTEFEYLKFNDFLLAILYISFHKIFIFSQLQGKKKTSHGRKLMKKGTLREIDVANRFRAFNRFDSEELKHFIMQMEHFFISDNKYFGTKGLSKIEDIVRNSMVNKIQTEKFAEKHYSVNLRAELF